ncbi:MAG: ribosome silencing factor [Corallococcus sp.]|nr:ribosome silencing factor [Corallococcus sp.]MCM1359393.1 ribosome silencing factor [Corallococcus sp.]MCM1394836.1 ribosome silencing factor [Corallococcus sp.]
MNEKVLEICKALSAKLATDIKIVEIKGVSDIADYFVLCSGRSAPQVKAIYDNLEETLEKLNIFALRKEGVTEGRWIAVDYGDVIVHIFHKDTREIYALDTLWNNGANVSDYKED